MTERVQGEANTFAYAYDTSGQLADVTRDGAPAGHYEYDANGNRTLASGVSATYDAQDRLLSVGARPYGHSASGELVTRPGANGATHFAYDELGQLTRAELADGRVVDYLFDATNHRVGKRVDGVLVRRWLWQSDLRIAAELDAAGAVASRFVYATRTNVPDYMVRAGVTYRLVTDPLGSPRLVVRADSGEVVQRMDFDEWGRVLRDTNPGFQPFGFAGGLWDADTGLVRFGAREYDPDLGRFTAKDPIGFAGGLTSLYGYVGGDPVNWVDPSGNNALLNALGGVAGIEAGINGAMMDYAVKAMNGMCTNARDAIAGFVGGVFLGHAIRGLAAGLRHGFRGGPNCFAAGTPVLGCDGTEQPIETLHAGDRVLSRDEHTGAVECRPVVRAFQRKASNLLSVTWARPDGSGAEALSVTAEHPFWVEGKGWTVAGSLQAGDEAFTATGERRIVFEKHALAGTVPVFNLEVESAHTYFVGDAEIWAHNAGCGGSPNRPAPALKGDPFHPDEVAKRQAAGSHDNGPLAAMAAGFRQTNYRGCRSVTDRESLGISAISRSVPAVCRGRLARQRGERSPGIVPSRETRACRGQLPIRMRRAPNYRSHGQPVYTDGRRFITPDVDRHNGGAWKMADSVRNLGSSATRMGTYDRELNWIGY